MLHSATALSWGVYGVTSTAVIDWGLTRGDRWVTICLETSVRWIALKSWFDFHGDTPTLMQNSRLKHFGNSVTHSDIYRKAKKIMKRFFTYFSFSFSQVKRSYIWFSQRSSFIIYFLLYFEKILLNTHLFLYNKTFWTTVFQPWGWDPIQGHL